MTPERWAQIRQIFDGALERAPKDRAAYLRVVCAGDDATRREVESLLASHEDASDFLAKPAAALGSALRFTGEESGEYPSGFRAGPYQLEKRDRARWHGVGVARRASHWKQPKSRDQAGPARDGFVGNPAPLSHGTAGAGEPESSEHRAADRWRVDAGGHAVSGDGVRGRHAHRSVLRISGERDHRPFEAVPGRLRGGASTRIRILSCIAT